MLKQESTEAKTLHTSFMHGGYEEHKIKSIKL